MNHYPPPRQPGLAVHAILIIVLAAVSVFAAYSTAAAEISLRFTLFVLLAALAFLPLPFLVYSFYALLRANYTLDRETLTLTWGLRVEQIPVADVEWVRSVHDLPTRLPRPLFKLPGAVLGIRRRTDLGLVEFLASDSRHLLLVAARKRIYAISPANPVVFARDFQRVMEMGSLAPMEGRSVYPSFILTQGWESPLARFLWLAGLFLNIGLLAWVSLLIPSLQRVTLGFQPSGVPMEPVPGVRLILLPIVSGFFSAAGWLGGVYFYLRPGQRVLAFILWASSALAALLFLLAVLFIVTTPV